MSLQIFSGTLKLGGGPNAIHLKANNGEFEIYRGTTQLLSLSEEPLKAGNLSTTTFLKSDTADFAFNKTNITGKYITGITFDTETSIQVQNNGTIVDNISFIDEDNVLTTQQKIPAGDYDMIYDTSSNSLTINKTSFLALSGAVSGFINTISTGSFFKFKQYPYRVYTIDVDMRKVVKESDGIIFIRFDNDANKRIEAATSDALDSGNPAEVGEHTSFPGRYWFHPPADDSTITATSAVGDNIHYRLGAFIYRLEVNLNTYYLTYSDLGDSLHKLPNNEGDVVSEYGQYKVDGVSKMYNTIQSSTLNEYSPFSLNFTLEKDNAGVEAYILLKNGETTFYEEKGNAISYTLPAESSYTHIEYGIKNDAAAQYTLKYVDVSLSEKTQTPTYTNEKYLSFSKTLLGTAENVDEGLKLSATIVGTMFENTSVISSDPKNKIYIGNNSSITMKAKRVTNNPILVRLRLSGYFTFETDVLSINSAEFKDYTFDYSSANETFFPFNLGYDKIELLILNQDVDSNPAEMIIKNAFVANPGEIPPQDVFDVVSITYEKASDVDYSQFGKYPGLWCWQVAGAIAPYPSGLTPGVWPSGRLSPMEVTNDKLVYWIKVALPSSPGFLFMSELGNGGKLANDISAKFTTSDRGVIARHTADPDGNVTVGETTTLTNEYTSQVAELTPMNIKAFLDTTTDNANSYISYKDNQTATITFSNVGDGSIEKVYNVHIPVTGDHIQTFAGKVKRIGEFKDGTTVKAFINYIQDDGTTETFEEVINLLNFDANGESHWFVRALNFDVKYTRIETGFTIETPQSELTGSFEITNTNVYTIDLGLPPVLKVPFTIEPTDNPLKHVIMFQRYALYADETLAEKNNYIEGVQFFIQSDAELIDNDLLANTRAWTQNEKFLSALYTPTDIIPEINTDGTVYGWGLSLSTNYTEDFKENLVKFGIFDGPIEIASIEFKTEPTYINFVERPSNGDESFITYDSIIVDQLISKSTETDTFWSTLPSDKGWGKMLWTFNNTTYDLYYKEADTSKNPSRIELSVLHSTDLVPFAPQNSFCGAVRSNDNVNWIGLGVLPTEERAKNYTIDTGYTYRFGFICHENIPPATITLFDDGTPLHLKYGQTISKSTETDTFWSTLPSEKGWGKMKWTFNGNEYDLYYKEADTSLFSSTAYVELSVLRSKDLVALFEGTTSSSIGAVRRSNDSEDQNWGGQGVLSTEERTKNYTIDTGYTYRFGFLCKDDTPPAIITLFDDGTPFQLKALDTSLMDLGEV